MNARSFATNENDVKAIDEFVKNAERYCISMSKAKFTGIEISASFAEKNTDLVKARIPHDRKCYDVLVKVII